MPSLSDRFLGALGLRRSVGYFPADWLTGMASGWYPQTTYGTSKVEEIGASYGSLMSGAYAGNPIVFSCINARAQLFSEARFQYQRLEKGRPGELFSTPSLGILEAPWEGGTTSKLLKDALIDADIGGNAFILREANGLRRLRPDWVTIIAGNLRTDATTWDLDTEVLGYQPGGPAEGKERIILDASEVAHFKSTHDPSRRFSGMSWLVPVLREIGSDQASTQHKTRYFEYGATPNMLVKFDQTMNLQKAQEWIDLFKREHEGSRNAYKTLFLGGGSDAEVVGANLRQVDFTSVQAAGELRIASAAGVPPIIIGLSGGLDAATYSNYGQARRAFADLTMRPLWRDMAGSLQRIIPTPSGNRLWYDDRDISFLQEDVKDAADIQSVQASAIRQLTDAGYDAKSIIDAIMAGDFNRLRHTGLFSVQLQPPGTTAGPEPAAPAATAPAPLLNASEPVGDVRCANCNRLVAKRTAPGGGFEVKCRGCSALVLA
jgi:phage portal protein BeeE